MEPSISSPGIGSPLRAEWARRVTDVCNSITAREAPGMLVRDGAGAHGNDPLPPNLRDRRFTKFDMTDRGCFRIISSVKNEQTGAITVTFGNVFYRQGACIEAPADKLEVKLSDSNSSAPDDKLGYLIICLKLRTVITREELGGADDDGEGEDEDAHPGEDETDFAKKIFSIYATTEEMRNDSRSTEHVIIPLYAIGKDGNVVIDFRNMPTAQMWETL